MTAPGAAKAGGVTVRVGVPLAGGQLVAAAKQLGYPTLFSANAFAVTYPPQHERARYFRRFRIPDPVQFAGLDAALDSSGFTAAAHYGDYRWTVEQYLDLVQSHAWAWWATLDLCCEPAIASDRPMRLLRIAATAHLLSRCREGARERGLSMPMPVLQGWMADEYLTCADWLPLPEWPAVVGLGSVCRRPLHGPHGILAILEALEAVLPAHVQLHLFGVKSSALKVLMHHPRVISVDSMAWDFAARAGRRTGRTMGYRIGHMAAWATRQQRIADRRMQCRAAQVGLFDPPPAVELGSREGIAQEALALCFADLVRSGALEYRDAVWIWWRDSVTVNALLAAHRRWGSDLIDGLDEVFGGLADTFGDLCEKYGVLA